MSDPTPDPKRPIPSICLNMIVRNEAHIVHEVLDCVAPYITYWVVVDTGSEDGTQDVIRNHMAKLGIPGEIHEREWVNFGVGRSQALDLAQGHADYIWVIDADDLVMGEPDFSDLTEDAYELLFGEKSGFMYWRAQLFKDGLPWSYRGVVHEHIDCAQPFQRKRLHGFYIDSRRLGGRNLDPRKYARDRDLLLAEMERDPNDARSAFYLAQSYFDLGDIANARKWYARRAEMGDWAEEVYYAMLRLAECMARLQEPWPDIQDAYLRAWEYRPIRSEALYNIAVKYRAEQRYRLAYMFAERAAKIPLPKADRLFVGAGIHNWRARDEQAVAASWIDKQAETFTLCRTLLARDDIPDKDRIRIACNRDLGVPRMTEAAEQYPERQIRGLRAGPRDSDVTVSLIAGPNRNTTERTLNTLLNTCLDRSRIGRFVVFDSGLWDKDRDILRQKYPFLEFVPTPEATQSQDRLAHLRQEIGGRFWLHLDEGWEFFAPENYIGRLTAVLAAEPTVGQVAINYEDAISLTGQSAPEDRVRRSDAAGRYVLTNVPARGPAMFAMDRSDRTHVGTATLDEVFCIGPAGQPLTAVPNTTSQG